MNLQTIEMAAHEARARYLEYRDYGTTEEDAAIARGYREVAKGTKVIQLRDAITIGGVDKWGRPKIAIMQADQRWCYLARETNGRVAFACETWPRSDRVNGVWRFPAGTLPTSDHWTNWAHRAMVPLVPPRHRPRHHLRNYAVLWEVDKWVKHTARPPRDPALLKHLGGDLYALLAVWDLTDLERAVISGTRLV
jgi:hypothetical protein